MEPIHVPAPPKQAFNKHRRVSDLIRKQVEHFKHLEHKLPEHLRRDLPQHPIVTEDDAARYIAPMTRLLLSQAGEPEASTGPVVMPNKARRQEAEGVSMAAAAQSANEKTSGSKTRKKPTARSSKRSKR